MPLVLGILQMLQLSFDPERITAISRWTKALRSPLDGQVLTRFFDISGPGTLDVTIRDLTFINGYGSDGATPTPVTSDGGAIRLGNENLLLENTVFTSNITDGSNDGGAISVAAGGNLIVRNSNLSGNIAGAGGGSGSDGGAIYVGNGGNVTVENSTLSGNASSGRGGAIYFDTETLNPGNLIVSNSTISGNITTSVTGTGGGGIFIQGTSGSVSIRNSTIVNNMSDSTSAVAGAGAAASPTSRRASASTSKAP